MMRDPSPDNSPGNGNSPQGEPETFRPDGVITSDAVLFHSLNLRAMALAEGLLVDVSEMAREAGFTVPVAVSAALWRDIHALPEMYAHEDVNGRLYDVLYMARIAIQQAKIDGPELRYNVVLHVEEREIYTVRLLAQPGDSGKLVITLSNPAVDKEVELGEIVLTPGALDAFASSRVSPAPYLARHQRGEWGELDAEDKATNDRALIEGTRLLSAYTIPESGERIWIITEWDRSVTTILIPSEY